MHRPIGWSDKDDEGNRREISVSMRGDDVFWQVKYNREGNWSKNFTPTVDEWQVLLDKLLELKQRGHLFDKEIAIVRKKLQG